MFQKKPSKSGSSFHAKELKPSKYKQHKSPGKGSSSKTHGSSSAWAQPDTSQPGVSFLFIVNELPTNDDPDVQGSVQQRLSIGHWFPPITSRDFLTQIPGNVYRWKDGMVSTVEATYWEAGPMGDPPYANGTIYTIRPDGEVIYPTYDSSGSVFYCNPFDKFYTASGDVSARDMATADPDPGLWLPLTFRHEHGISYTDYAGDQSYLAVQSADWIEQLVPRVYRAKEAGNSAQGGLAGFLPIVIALVAFSCKNRDLNRVLLRDRSWQGQHWRAHSRPTGRQEKRGMVVTVYLDPENPDGSTWDTLGNVENGNTPIFR